MFKKIFEFLALRQSMVGLLGMVILVGMGERMAERFLPIYITSLGASVIAVGVLSGLMNLLGALYSFPGGYIADRIGTKRSLLIFNLMSIFGYLIVILIPSWQAAIFGAIFFLAWSAISLPASMSLVSRVLPKDKRTMGVTMHSLVRRFPMALGPILGGIFIGIWGEVDGVRVAFAVAILLAFFAMAMQQKFIIDDVPEQNNNSEKNFLKLFRKMDPKLKNLLVSDILIRFCEQIPYAFVVIWCMKTIEKPVTAVEFGFLTSIEMLTAVLVYIPVAYFADKTEKKPFIIITFINFTLFPFMLYFCHSFWPLVFAFMLRGLKEFGEPTRKALILDLCGEESKAAKFGLYYLVRDIIVSVAAFGGSFLWFMSPLINFASAFVFGLIGTLLFAFYGKDNYLK